MFVEVDSGETERGERFQIRIVRSSEPEASKSGESGENTTVKIAPYEKMKKQMDDRLD